MSESGKRGVLKNFFEKSFRKIWRLQKNTLPLHHFRADKTARGQKQKERAARLNQIERTTVRSRDAFFEVIEQLNKFFPSLRKKRNFKTIPLRLELRFN